MSFQHGQRKDKARSSSFLLFSSSRRTRSCSSRRLRSPSSSFRLRSPLSAQCLPRLSSLRRSSSLPTTVRPSPSSRRRFAARSSGSFLPSRRPSASGRRSFSSRSSLRPQRPSKTRQAPHDVPPPCPRWASVLKELNFCLQSTMSKTFFHHTSLSPILSRKKRRVAFAERRGLFGPRLKHGGNGRREPFFEKPPAPKGLVDPSQPRTGFLREL